MRLLKNEKSQIFLAKRLQISMLCVTIFQVKKESCNAVLKEGNTRKNFDGSGGGI